MRRLREGEGAAGEAARAVEPEAPAERPSARPVTPREVVALQRAAGNRAVAGMLSREPLAQAAGADGVRQSVTAACDSLTRAIGPLLGSAWKPGPGGQFVGDEATASAGRQAGAELTLAATLLEDADRTISTVDDGTGGASPVSVPALVHELRSLISSLRGPTGEALPMPVTQMSQNVAQLQSLTVRLRGGIGGWPGPAPSSATAAPTSASPLPS